MKSHYEAMNLSPDRRKAYDNIKEGLLKQITDFEARGWQDKIPGLQKSIRDLGKGLPENKR